MGGSEQRTRQRSVSTTNPWLLVVMVDGSHSMSADWVGTKRSMAELVEQSVNNMLYDMALNFSGTGEGALKDRIHLRLLVYSGEDVVMDPIPLPEGSNYLCSDGESGWVQNWSEVHQYPGTKDEVPRWFELVPEGKTPMLKAFQTARTAVEQHISEYPDSFPPVVLNISDGDPSDCGNPIDWDLVISECDSIRSLGYDGCSPLICNVHLDPQGRGHPSLYADEPPRTEGIEDGLWLASSKFSDVRGGALTGLPSSASDGEGERRFFVFNSDLVHFHEFLDFSTLMANRVPKNVIIDIDFTEEE